MERLFFFTAIYSVEYKEGIAKEDLDSLFKVESYFPINFGNSDKVEEKEPEYFEKFCDKYEDIRSSFYYYPTIANYVHFGYIPEDFESLIKTIRNEIKKEEESEDAVSLKKIKNWELIEGEEFNDLIGYILDLVDKCKFNLYTYPAIYAQLIQLEYMQIENFKLTNEIKNLFFKAIDESKKTHKFEYTFNMRIPQWDYTDKSGGKDKYQEIYSYALRANEEVGNLEHKNEIDKFVEMVSSNNIKGLEDYMYNINNKDIIKNINVEIPTGKLVVITGPNGGGKTSLAKLIAGLEKPTSGSIILDEEDITSLDITERANKGISYAFQQPVRFKGITVRDLLELAAGKKIEEKEICSLLGKVGLCTRDYIDREVNSSLSGGEIKRIEIATVLARNTKLTIFDEPEAGIDLWSFNELIDAFVEIKENYAGTLLIISHQERILNIADEIIVIANGVVKDIGKKEEILPTLLEVSNTGDCCLNGGNN